MNIGLKLWSINENYLKPAKQLFLEGVYDYIELFVVPGSAGYLPLWKQLQIPFIIHAPHSVSGLNPANPALFESNKTLAREAFLFMHELAAPYIIFHPGRSGTEDESIRQFLAFGNTHKMLIENKPYQAIDDEKVVFVGSEAKSLKKIIDGTGADFCLDIGHAICAANSYKKDKLQFIKDLTLLNPKLYHFSDGDINSPIDKHYNFGKGSYDFEQILPLLDNNISISIETQKNSETNLEDFRQDVAFLKALYK